MAQITGLPYVADADARILILGSIPSQASLAAQQYYAHPRNLFWDFIEALFGIKRLLPYKSRLAELKKHKIALWDVIEQCERNGSLDTAIDSASIVGNDLPLFLEQFQQIEHICFNGRKAETTFCRQVLPLLGDAALQYHCLPSTSPANAALSYEEKLSRWKKLEVLLFGVT